MCKDAYANEQKFVLKSFEHGFSQFQDSPIVLYGLGKNTEVILHEYAEKFHFVGLMDARNTGEVFFGYPVLTEEEVKRIHPIIAIIARDSVQGIIFRRIQHLQEEYGIQIFNYKGDHLSCEAKISSNENLSYWKSSEEELKKAILAAEIVSFDIFDTLVMRKVLEPKDVFWLVEQQWNTLREKRGQVPLPFSCVRVQSEQKYSTCPSMEAIYAQIKDELNLQESEIAELMDLEFHMEQSILIPRKPVVQYMKFAIENGKPVYLISDMYYSSQQLKSLLEPLGIEGYEKIFVSSEFGKSKEDGGLYEEFLRFTGKKSILHIGDNRRADIEQAEKYGLLTYQLYSGQELLSVSSMQSLLSDIQEIASRLLLGLFVANAFQDPFVLCESRGKVQIKDLKNLGYLYFGPLLSEITIWLRNEIQEKKIDQLLFPSRDGYLMQKLYALLCQMEDSECQYPNHLYFRTSRRAVSVAALKTVDDIRFLMKRKFHGSNEAFLWKRFGVCLDQLDEKNKYENKEDSEAFILQHTDAILKNAEKERTPYLAYLHKMHIGEGQKIALFDFVSGGTVQYYLEKLLGKKMYGLYAATSNLPNDRFALHDGIEAAYGNFTSYGTTYALERCYLVLEAVIAEPQETFMRFDQKGQEEYCDKTSASQAEIGEIQSGILAYANDWFQLRKLAQLPVSCLKKADEILGMAFQQCDVAEHIKNIFENDDEYDGFAQYKVWSSES